MAMIKSVVYLHHRSGLPRDDDQVTFYYDNSGLTGINTLIQNFWAVRRSPQIQPLISYYAPCLSGSGTIKSYAMGDPPGVPTGPPFDVSPLTFGTPGSSLGLPAEVAFAISYHADYTSIPEHSGRLRPRASYRGRIFLGPLNVSTKLDDSTTGETRIFSQFFTDCQIAYQHLQQDMNYKLQVFSRKNHALYPVIGGWVDDAFDTQRRRGPDPTLKGTFTTP